MPRRGWEMHGSSFSPTEFQVWILDVFTLSFPNVTFKEVRVKEPAQTQTLSHILATARRRTFQDQPAVRPTALWNSSSRGEPMDFPLVYPFELHLFVYCSVRTAHKLVCAADSWSTWAFWYQPGNTLQCSWYLLCVNLLKYVVIYLICCSICTQVGLVLMSDYFWVFLFSLSTWKYMAMFLMFYYAYFRGLLCFLQLKLKKEATLRCPRTDASLQLTTFQLCLCLNICVWQEWSTARHNTSSRQRFLKLFYFLLPLTGTSTDKKVGCSDASDGRSAANLRCTS